MKYLVHASYLEIYNEEVRDLLGKDIKKKMDLKEHPDKGVWVPGKSKDTYILLIFFSTPLPRQCKGGLPVHKSGMPLSASKGPGPINALLCPSFTPGEPTI